MTTSVLIRINIFFLILKVTIIVQLILPMIANFFYSAHKISNILLVSCQSRNYVLLWCITQILIVILYFKQHVLLLRKRKPRGQPFFKGLPSNK